MVRTRASEVKFAPITRPGRTAKIAEALRESIADLRLRYRFNVMARSGRNQMTARVVPLESDDAGEGRVGDTPTERLVLLADLSRRMWELTRLPQPDYNRIEGTLEKVLVPVISLDDLVTNKSLRSR